MKIPKRFKLFATTIEIKWDNERMNDKRRYGECDYSQSLIILSKTNGVDKLSEGKILDTFYHEKTHMILNSMHRSDLSEDELFVDTFAKLLRQADETAEY